MPCVGLPESVVACPGVVFRVTAYTRADDELVSQGADVVASGSKIEWQQGQDALRDEVARVTTLLRSIRDPGASAVGQWNLAEVAMHLSQAWIAVPGLARRDLSRVHEVVPSLAGGAGDSLIRDMWDLGDMTTLAVNRMIVHSERTGGRVPGLGRHPLALPRGQRTAVEAENLQGDVGTGLQDSPESAKDDAAKLVEHASGRATGDAAQRWPLHGRGGWTTRVDPPDQDEIGGGTPPSRPALDTSPREASVHSAP
jgi:hypothetical protein